MFTVHAQTCAESIHVHALLHARTHPFSVAVTKQVSSAWAVLSKLGNVLVHSLAAVSFVAGSTMYVPLHDVRSGTDVSLHLYVTCEFVIFEQC